LYGHTRTETHLWTLPTKPSVDLQRGCRLKTSPGQTLDSRQPKRPNEAERTSGNTLVLSWNLPTILPTGNLFTPILHKLFGLQDFQKDSQCDRNGTSHYRQASRVLSKTHGSTFWVNVRSREGSPPNFECLIAWPSLRNV